MALENGKASGYWTVEYLQSENAVQTTASGELTLVLVMQKAGETFQKAANHQTDNFLVDDLEVQPRLTTLEMYRLPSILEPLGLTRQAKIAVVYSPASALARDLEFMENVAINQGFNVRLFTTSEEAKEWLQNLD
jgi:hypothetical protein